MNKLDQKYIDSNLYNCFDKIEILQDVTSVAHKLIIVNQIEQKVTKNYGLYT